MNASLRIGRLFGIPIDLHWTLLLVVGWVFYDGFDPGGGLRWARIGWVSGVIGLLFLFVLIHELGHALAGKATGANTEKILLFPLGGGAYITSLPERSRDELLVYFGGPLANLVLAGLLFPVLFFDAERWQLLQFYLSPDRNFFLPALWWEEMLCLSLFVNLVLAVVNLLPAYPLDGGRILQAALRRRVGIRRATLVVTCSGILAGLGFIWLGWRIGDYLMSFGGVFVAFLSAYEINRGWQRRRLERFSVADVFRPLPQRRLYVSDAPEAARQLLQSTGWPALPVYNEWNQLLGLVNEETLEEGSGQNLGGHYDPAFATSLRDENLLVVTEKIIEADAYGALVYERQQPVGLLLMDDIMGLLKRRIRVG